MSLDAAVLMRLEKAAARADDTLPLVELRLTASDREFLAPEVRPIQDALERGRGFVVVERLDVPRLGKRRATAMYWLLGQALGEPFPQNVQGTLLYDVTDTGRTVQEGARFSVTNAESSFHTDNSFGDRVLDWIGLLCLQPARSGGVNQLVSGAAACEILQRARPDVVEVLAAPFQVDRRGGIRPGETATIPVPVLSRVGPDILVRYLRFWIEAGHIRLDRPLTPVQRDALDTFDRALSDPALRAEFTLDQGQILFANNRWILHNRTAFDDDPDPEKRRHLVRLWLSKATD